MAVIVRAPVLYHSRHGFQVRSTYRPRCLQLKLQLSWAPKVGMSGTYLTFLQEAVTALSQRQWVQPQYEGLASYFWIYISGWITFFNELFMCRVAFNYDSICKSSKSSVNPEGPRQFFFPHTKQNSILGLLHKVGPLQAMIAQQQARTCRLTEFYVFPVIKYLLLSYVGFCNSFQSFFVCQYFAIQFTRLLSTTLIIILTQYSTAICLLFSVSASICRRAPQQYIEI